MLLTIFLWFFGIALAGLLLLLLPPFYFAVEMGVNEDSRTLTGTGHWLHPAVIRIEYDHATRRNAVYLFKRFRVYPRAVDTKEDAHKRQSQPHDKQAAPRQTPASAHRPKDHATEERAAAHAQLPERKDQPAKETAAPVFRDEQAAQRVDPAVRRKGEELSTQHTPPKMNDTDAPQPEHHSSSDDMQPPGESAPNETPQEEDATEPSGKAWLLSRISDSITKLKRKIMQSKAWFFLHQRRFIKKIVTLALRFILNLLKIVRFDCFVLRCRASLADPALTASVAGITYGIRKALSPSRLPRSYDLVFTPEFNEAPPSCDIRLAARTSLLAIVLPFIILVFTFPYLHALLVWLRFRKFNRSPKAKESVVA
ncbi:MAG: hypothetical protein GF398_18400 [Chitinivibrionales bacterium]|nr:hypothetical protein [Chitinivibrionales bacterium]